MNSHILSNAKAANMLSKSGSGLYAPACHLRRPASHLRQLPRRVLAKAFTPVVRPKAAPVNNLTGPGPNRRKSVRCAASSDTGLEEEDVPKVATEFITQALFNYFSCSAVAIATVVGGSNATMVTALMIAAHMVLVPMIAYVAAPASGAHFNPIVTFAFMATGILEGCHHVQFCSSITLSTRVKTGISYIIAQCVGGVMGAYAAFNLLPVREQVTELAGLHIVPDNHTVTQAFFGEGIASFFFIWVIMGLVKSKNGWGRLGPFAIALGITFNMWITGPISSNCINPARALGPAVVTGFWEHHWVWWTAPFVGAFLAAKLYAKYVMPKDQLKELRTEAGTA